MARSIKGSSQRPDTLMQDRTSANSMKVLLQRAAGPYIWVIHVIPAIPACPVHPKRWGNRPASLRIAENQGAALQADGETRSADAASGIRRRSAGWIILLDSMFRSRHASAASACGTSRRMVPARTRFSAQTLLIFERVSDSKLRERVKQNKDHAE